MEAACVAFPARRSARSGAKSDAVFIGRAPRHSGRPPERNPKGRGLLCRGFVEGLARSPTTRCALLLPTPQNTSGAGVSHPGGSCSNAGFKESIEVGGGNPYFCRNSVKRRNLKRIAPFANKRSAEPAL